MPRPARTAFALVALAVALTACGADASTDTATSDPRTPSDASAGPRESPAGATPEIPEILDFEAPLLAGGTLRGADYAGKDVAFWFWAPW